jgi:hypothetical protein
MNTNDHSATIDLSRFSERIGNLKRAKDIATGNQFNLEQNLSLGGKYLLVLELLP